MLQIFTRIIFPLTSPGLLTVALIVSLNVTATGYDSDWPQMRRLPR
jgi:ABC-type spermidine/putrescine transport system permease subunit I